MLTAIKKLDNKKYVGSMIPKKKGEEFFCEYCLKTVIHHNSESNIRCGHFKHKKGESDCPNNTKESEYHYRTKTEIYNYIKENWGNKLVCIELEKWICDNTIRADIYIETKKNKIAIEVQATILTVTDIKRRTFKYTHNNIYVLWILPFEYERIFDFKIVQYNRGNEPNVYGWVLSKKVKLKEMELYLYWAYFKKLFFWDLEHSYSDSFVCVNFIEHKSDDVEFRQDGEDYYYYGKTSKTLKKVDFIRNNLEFTDFNVSFAREFQPPFRDYIIPPRKLFTILNY